MDSDMERAFNKDYRSKRQDPRRNENWSESQDPQRGSYSNSRARSHSHQPSEKQNASHGVNANGNMYGRVTDKQKWTANNYLEYLDGEKIPPDLKFTMNALQ